MTAQERYKRMSAVKDRDTRPEMAVRRLLHKMGYRYRLHAADLPGKPDIVFRKRKLALFVHGCFWHGHRCRFGQREPKSNSQYWVPKLRRNVERDKAIQAELESIGWRCAVIWECETKAVESLESLILDLLR